MILPTYNEKDSIRQVILDFFATGVVDEVIVVNNNAVAGTSEESPAPERARCWNRGRDMARPPARNARSQRRSHRDLRT